MNEPDDHEAPPDDLAEATEMLVAVLCAVVHNHGGKLVLPRAQLDSVPDNAMLTVEHAPDGSLIVRASPQVMDLVNRPLLPRSQL